MYRASRNIFIYAGVLIIFLAIASIFLGSSFLNSKIEGTDLEHNFQKGMSFIAWTKDGYSKTKADESLEDLALLGVNWVALITTWYQDNIDSVEVYPIVSNTPSDASLIHAIRKIHNLHMKVMLKPHVDLVKPDGFWRGDIYAVSGEFLNGWYDSYKEFILRYARIAQDNNVEMFCVGTELTTVALAKPDFFKYLIKEVRKVYNGKLTYAANWYDEYSGIDFWDELDYVGIDPYFPLSDKTKPSFEEIKNAWQDWVPHLEVWHKKIKKPVIFTEIGYKSSTGSAISPWEHMPGKNIDLQLQVDCYKALLETFWDKPWLEGIYWWYWGVHPGMGGKDNRDFTPQHKPAEDIIAEWYNKKH